MNEDGRAFLQKQFDFERWSGRNRLDENLLIWRYRLSQRELPQWQPARIQELEPPPEQRLALESRAGRALPVSWSRATHSMWQAADGGLLNIDIYECDTRQQAHQFLLRLLGEFQSPVTLLRETDDIGDVAFRNESDTVILFARANLVVLARNANPTRVPITEAIKGLDERFTARPAEASEREIPALRRWPVTKKAKAGANVRLSLEPTTEAAEPVWYKYFVQEGDIRIEEDNLVYEPPSAGEHELMVYEESENQAPASRMIRIVAS